eukprot:9071919-Alexandrium_andersonii.AAC.1
MRVGRSRASRRRPCRTSQTPRAPRRTRVMQRATFGQRSGARRTKLRGALLGHNAGQPPRRRRCAFGAAYGEPD